MLFLGKKGWLAAMLPSSVKLLIRCAVGICLGSAVWGQANLEVRPKPGEKTEPRPRANIRVDSNLVLIPVTVTDPLNRFVTGLEKENFKLLEDKLPQEISQFSSEDAPLSVGVVFDCSGSMGHKLDKSRQAVAQFFKLANPEDEFFLVQFNDSANMVQTFTHAFIQQHNLIPTVRQWFLYTEPDICRMCITGGASILENICLITCWRIMDILLLTLITQQAQAMAEITGQVFTDIWEEKTSLIR